MRRIRPITAAAIATLARPKRRRGWIGWDRLAARAGTDGSGGASSGWALALVLLVAQALFVHEFHLRAVVPHHDRAPHLPQCPGGSVQELLTQPVACGTALLRHPASPSAPIESRNRSTSSVFGSSAPRTCWRTWSTCRNSRDAPPRSWRSVRVDARWSSASSA